MRSKLNWPRTVVAVLAIVSIFAISIQFFDGVGAQEEEPPPTIVPADALTPAPKPPDERRVAVLDMEVESSEDGRVTGVRLLEDRIVESYAPNVFSLRGPWTLELVGETETKEYGILDPRSIHVLDESDEAPYEEIPHETIFDVKAIWQLVVPLFDRDQDLQVREITIRDEIGKPIFAAEVDSAGQFTQVSPPPFCVDFHRFSSGQMPGPDFWISGWHFSSWDEAEPPVFVDEKPFVALQFAPAGIRIYLPLPADEVVLTAVAHATELEIIAVDAEDNTVVSAGVPADDELHEVSLQGDTKIAAIDIIGGEFEGRLVTICINNR